MPDVYLYSGTSVHFIPGIVLRFEDIALNTQMKFRYSLAYILVTEVRQ